uniref:Uncharacterized protein n=1 Tax=Zea mays TaxID=4577 RepID=A0A804NVX3_MAIZE
MQGKDMIGRARTGLGRPWLLLFLSWTRSSATTRRMGSFLFHMWNSFNLSTREI